VRQGKGKKKWLMKRMGSIVPMMTSNRLNMPRMMKMRIDFQRLLRPGYEIKRRTNH
jgi:hypothetical protein